MNASIEELKIKNSKSYTVAIDVPFVVEEGFPENAAIVLTFINGAAEGHDVGMPNGGRRFVPTFEATKSGEEQILAWSNLIESRDEPEGEPVIKIKAVANLKDKTLSVTGEGFIDATIEVIEFEAPAVPEEKPEE